MRICGIDPGMEITGYGVLEMDGPRLQLVRAGVFRTSAAAPLPQRLRVLYEGFRVLLAEVQPAQVVLEELYSHYAHPTTAILMGHVRGVILLAAGQAGLPVAHYLPTHVKKAVTGRGHATKEQVQRMIQALLSLPVPLTPDDATDAIGVAMAHAHALRAPVTSHERRMAGAVR